MTRNLNHFVIIISGATATGKSSLALQMAQQISDQSNAACVGEIINGDIGSFYKPLTIGTAKPDWQSEKIPHHFFDIFDTPQDFTVVQFRQRLAQLIQEIWDRGNVPIVVGGSAFYIQSFFYKQHDIAGTEKHIAQLEQDARSTQELWQELHAVDAQRAAAVYPQDRYRIIRALAIYQATGRKPSEFTQQFEPLAPFYFIVCSRDREQLYAKINARVQEMLNAGWQEEVEKLRGTAWQAFLQRKKLIGYDDLLAHPLSPQLQEIIAQKTRNYAKRQIIFLNKLQKQVARDLQISHDKGHVKGHLQDIDLTLCGVGLYINELSKLTTYILKIFG